MTDPGLNHRLRQRSRRAGVMIGISMALTIAVCVGSFSVIYASLDNVLGDFVSRSDTIAAAPTQPPAEQPAQNQQAAAAKPTEAPAAAQPTVAPTAAPTAAPSPTAQSNAFKPDYQISGSGSVNFRAGPSRESEIITSLPLETPLQYLKEDAPTEDPAEDGDRWMKFRTEDGQEGWIREIDVTQYVP